MGDEPAVVCRHCGINPRWRDGDWCATCTVTVCCRHYPRPVDGRMVDCVHGDVLRRTVRRG